MRARRSFPVGDKLTSPLIEFQSCTTPLSLAILPAPVLWKQTSNFAPAFGVVQGPLAHRSGSSWLELPDHRVFMKSRA
jgi:hypothetical protein